MRYFLKVYGNASGLKANSNFNEMGIKENAAYYFLNSKIFFGRSKPTKYFIGDIFIQYAPLSLKCKFAGRILGVYESTSNLKEGEIIEIDEITGIPKVYETYIDVKNLNFSFSQKSMYENLLNMRDEKFNINFPTGSIACGFAYLSEKDAKYLIEKVNSLCN